MHAGIDDLVALPDQFIDAVTTDVAERIIDLDDPSIPIGHRDNGMHIERGEQGVGGANGGFQPLLGLLLGGDVGTDFHEAYEHTITVAGGLHLGVNPVFAPVLGPVDHFHPAGHSQSDRAVERFNCGRI